MNYLPGNLKALRKKLALTQSGLAEKISVNRSAIGAYEEGRADPRVQTLIRMGIFFKVSVDDLLNMDLSVETPKAYTADQLRVLPVMVDKESEKELIPLIPEKAAAGYLSNYNDPEFISDLDNFNMPFPQLAAERTYRMFQIEGNSMLPIPSNSYIIGQYLSSLDEVKEGMCYVLATKNEGIVYKRLSKKQKNTLTLSSDNPEYAAYDMHAKEVLEIWKALGYTSFELPSSGDYQPQLNEISSAIKQLQQQIIPDNEPDASKSDQKDKSKKKKKKKGK